MRDICLLRGRSFDVTNWLGNAMLDRSLANLLVNAAQDKLLGKRLWFGRVGGKRRMLELAKGQGPACQSPRPRHVNRPSPRTQPPLCATTRATNFSPDGSNSGGVMRCEQSRDLC